MIFTEDCKFDLSQKNREKKNNIIEFYKDMFYDPVYAWLENSPFYMSMM